MKVGTAEIHIVSDGSLRMDGGSIKPYGAKLINQID